MCDPTPSMEVASVACPEPSSVPEPSVIAPSLNTTVPVGVAALAVTVAVSVTGWPDTAGFADEERVVVVGTYGPKPTRCPSYVPT